MGQSSSPVGSDYLQAGSESSFNCKTPSPCLNCLLEWENPRPNTHWDGEQNPLLLLPWIVQPSPSYKAHSWGPCLRLARTLQMRRDQSLGGKHGNVSPSACWVQPTGGLFLVWVDIRYPCKNGELTFPRWGPWKNKKGLYVLDQSQKVPPSL